MAGQAVYSGVTPESIACYEELCQMANEGRTEAGLKVEEAFLEKLRAEAKIEVWTDAERKKAKRNKSEQKVIPAKPCKSLEDARKGFDGFFG